MNQLEAMSFGQAPDWGGKWEFPLGNVVKQETGKKMSSAWQVLASQIWSTPAQNHQKTLPKTSERGSNNVPRPATLTLCARSEKCWSPLAFGRDRNNQTHIPTRNKITGWVQLGASKVLLKYIFPPDDVDDDLWSIQSLSWCSNSSKRFHLMKPPDHKT